MRESVKEKKVQKRYDGEFKRQAVKLVIHSGRSQAQIARELGVSEYSLTLWKRAYLGHLKPGQLDGEQMSPEQMFEKIRQQQKEIEYLKRQREILKKAMSNGVPFLSLGAYRQARSPSYMARTAVWSLRWPTRRILIAGTLIVQKAPELLRRMFG
jgi:transposase